MNLEDLKGIGPKTLQKLNLAGINSLNDLINLEPKEYISLVLNNEIKEEKSLIYVTNVKLAKVTSMSNNAKMIIFSALFNGKNYKFIIFSKEYMTYILDKNKSLYLYVNYVKEKNYFNVHKIFVDKPNDIKVIYKISDISDTNISKLIFEAFNYFKAPKERLPLDIVNKYKFISYKDYLLLKHFPKNNLDLKQVMRRKIYENFFYRNVFYQILNIKNIKDKDIKEFNDNDIFEFVKLFSFKLTNDQEKVSDLILKETKSSKRINMLIEGDVGSGKTVVALISAYANILANYQVAFLAPTVILANQHYNLAKKYIPNTYLLTSNLKKKEKEEILNKIKTEDNILVIGTHAILEDDVIFKKLGLVIIDEQQRFGVLQRSILQKKYPHVDTLYFTATPIPRSLAMTYYGGLDLAIIKDKPMGRKAVKTKLIKDSDLAKIIPFLKERLAANEQIFIVCPLIYPNEDSLLWDISKTKNYFKDLLNVDIGIIHGELKDKEKVEIIRAFNDNEIKVLVATTIIEVGIDIKNATTLILLDANRYGLSTIHQLRGRVGRGNLDSYMFLVSPNLDNERLKILEEVNDGFTLAEYDLKLRGPGEFLSRSQSGFTNQLETDLEKKIYSYAVEDAKEYATKLIANNEVVEYEKILNEINLHEYENN